MSRPGKRGEGETAEVVPIIVWDGTLGAALLDLPPGTPLTVIGRISTREWTAPGGQTKTFLEVVGESVTVGVETLGAGGESSPAAPTARPHAAPAVPSRPANARATSRDDAPF